MPQLETERSGRARGAEDLHATQERLAAAAALLKVYKDGGGQQSLLWAQGHAEILDSNRKS